MGLNQEKWIKAKTLVNDRDGGRCLKCFGDAEAVHHRIPRGMGGTSDDEVNYDPANLISLCAKDHAWVHENPGEAYQAGFLVHRWEDPASIPVQGSSNATFMLTKTGQIYAQLRLFLSDREGYTRVWRTLESSVAVNPKP